VCLLWLHRCRSLLKGSHVSAVDEWRKECKKLIEENTSTEESLLYAVLAKSQFCIERLDNLVEALTEQVLNLRSAESQWMPQHSQQSGIIKGPVGANEDLLESNDIATLVKGNTQ
jgi:hypothetical protein